MEWLTTATILMIDWKFREEDEISLQLEEEQTELVYKCIRRTSKWSPEVST